MSTDEFNSQDGRFRMVYADEAGKLGVPEAEQFRDEFASLLLDFAATPPAYVGDDCCSPEDATLTRDFSWVAEAMNRLAVAALAERQGELRKAKVEALREALGLSVTFNSILGRVGPSNGIGYIPEAALRRLLSKYSNEGTDTNGNEPR